MGTAARAAIISDRRITGLSADVAGLVGELGPLWHERHQARLEARSRKRAVGPGARHRLVFIDRLLAALVHLRHGATHDVLACWFGVDRSTVTRAIHEVRPLLGERGCSISQGLRPRTLAEVIDHLGAGGRTGIIDGTEIQVRRPAPAARTGRSSSSARTRRTPSRPLVLTDASGRHLFCSPKGWRSLTRHLGRREHMSNTVQPIAGLLSHQQTTTRGDRQPQ
ncbi:transposase family protein [Streptomyces roseus]|uniref:helix-turn-helix domain-containing protein n=1 Tax=Streptomyces roseus TaxID=66430 RepID=UPI003818A98A